MYFLGGHIASTFTKENFDLFAKFLRANVEHLLASVLHLTHALTTHVFPSIREVGAVQVSRARHGVLSSLRPAADQIETGYESICKASVLCSVLCVGALVRASASVACQISASCCRGRIVSRAFARVLCHRDGRDGPRFGSVCPSIRRVRHIDTTHSTFIVCKLRFW